MLFAVVGQLINPVTHLDAGVSHNNGVVFSISLVKKLIAT